MRLISRFEQESRLDGAVSAGQRVARLIPRGKLRDVLHGVWVGHPLHPILVQAPVGAWLSASFLDFTGDVPRLKPANMIPESARRAISGMKVKRYMEGRGEDAREVEVIEFKLWPKVEAMRRKVRMLIGLWSAVASAIVSAR